MLELKNIVKRFPVQSGFFGARSGYVHAVNSISLDIQKGETLGLVGESGSGKSTIAKIILRLILPDEGTVIFDEKDISRNIQMIFQDPYSSLNPRLTIKEIIEEPLIVHNIGNKIERSERVNELLHLTGLSPAMKNKYPHEFSGGQRQRIGIARAIAPRPKLVIADEPVSALDVSIRSEIIALLKNIKQQFDISYLFISHDLAVVTNISTRIAVMYLGKLMEVFPTTKIGNALHPYTQALISAAPVPDPRIKKKRIIIEGDAPSPVNLPNGCVFNPRCQYATIRCRKEEPKFEQYTDDCFAACHFIREMKTMSPSPHPPPANFPLPQGERER